LSKLNSNREIENKLFSHSSGFKNITGDGEASSAVGAGDATGKFFGQNLEI